MPDTFGARLRHRREQQGIDLVAIADQTKIKTSLLEALERDDVSQWPSGIFRRAFIRAYAHAIGLNPDHVVREFLEVYPEPSEIVSPVDAVATVIDQRHGSSGTRLRSLVGSALGSWSRLRRGPQEPQPAETPATSLNVRSVPPAFGTTDPTIQTAAAATDPPREEEPAIGTFAAAAAEYGELADTLAADAAEPESDVPFVAADAPDAAVIASHTADLLEVARLCTELGRVTSARHLQDLLQDLAIVLDASGVIVWLWNGDVGCLVPVLAHGYSDRVIAQLPAVSRDADNATAAAFRSSQPCVMAGTRQASGALAVPLLTVDGCCGVLALEMRNGQEQSESARALATIFAALLAQLTGSPVPRQQEAGDAVDVAEIRVANQ